MARKNRKQAAPSPRGLAARVLRQLEQRQGFSNRVLSEHLERHSHWDARDRGLVTTLVYGVLRHRTRLDAHIDAHARQPGKLRGELRAVLRVGAYELVELHHPPHAVLTEAAGVAGQLAGGEGMRRAISGILASVAEHAAATDARLAGGAPLDVLDQRWSIPRWLGGRWRKTLGDDAALARARALAEPPPIDVRLDLGRITADQACERLRADHPRVQIERVDDQPQALRLRRAGDLFYGPLHDDGLLSIQGLAAQQPARWLAPKPGERILDACAGLGVKTLQLAELMERRGTLIAADVDDHHAADHEALAQRGRLPPELALDYIVADLAKPHPALDAEPFDAVLLDVPCTGLGNLARHPEIRWQRRYEDLAARAELQRTLLHATLPRVRPGGRLVYAVCSPDPMEGRAVVDAVIGEAPGWTTTRSHTFTPEGDGTEGFFVARLDRAR